MSDRLEARKERKAQNDAYLARIKELAENDDRIELDLGGTTVSSTVTSTEGGVTTTASISTDGPATFDTEQQNNLQRVSNDPSLAAELIADAEEENKNLDKKIAQEEGTYDYNDSEPFEGGTEVPNNTPDVKIKYPYNWVQTTSAGHMFEMNNTEDGEYIRLLNANGNFLNLDQDQNNSLVSYNDLSLIHI